MLINAQNISYRKPDATVLFEEVSFTVNKGDKTAIVGKNGIGKSTLLKIIAGNTTEYNGVLQINGTLYYVPQHYGHFDEVTVAEALGIAPILQAMQAIENGSTEQAHYDLMEHTWDIVARYEEAFASWGLAGLQPDQPLRELSGGMKTKLFLSGIQILQPDIVLLDEPTNHLDTAARNRLSDWISTTNCAVLLTSHDRQLLRICDPIWELTPTGILEYGGNYDFYEEQKEIEIAAQEHKLEFHTKALKEAKKKAQEALERKQHADAQARKSVRNSSDPKILLNARRNAAEASTGKLKSVHAEKVNDLRSSLQEVAAMTQMQQIMKGFFDSATMPAGKVLFQANDINFAWPGKPLLWTKPLTFTIRSGNRISIAGSNGKGKSTLLKILLDQLEPTTGTLQRTPCTKLLLDQDYSGIDRNRKVLEQALAFNERKLDEAQVHTTLANFLFKPDSWEKPCSVLSGGEMLRLSLCCMVLQNRTPDIIFLDEPVNNLDLVNIRMLAKIFRDYKGTVILISHDQTFTEETGIEEVITLE